MELYYRDTTRVIPFALTAASTHLDPLTGVDAVVTLSKNHGPFAQATGVVAEVGNGNYELTPSAADVGTRGPLVVHVEAPGGDPFDEVHQVISLIVNG